MAPFFIWITSLMACTAGFFWLQSATPEHAFAIAAVALTLMLAQLVMTHLAMGRLVDGMSRFIKSEWLGNRAAEFAVLAPSYALMFVIDYFVDFKHLQLQPVVGWLLALLAIFVASLYFTTAFTGGFQARSHRPRQNN